MGMQMTRKQKYRRVLLALAALFLILAVLLGYDAMRESLPDTMYVDENSESPFQPLTKHPLLTISEDTKEAEKNEFGETGETVVECSAAGIPLKKIRVIQEERPKVAVCGAPVGIYMETDGVMVIRTAEIRSSDGTVSRPSENILREGDYITKVNGQSIRSKQELIDAVKVSNGSPVCLSLLRDGETIEVQVTPQKSQDGTCRLGAWVRDNMQGIGTLTFVEPDGTFAALGHGISDVDTGKMLQLNGGELYLTQILSVIPGKAGVPGELQGVIHYEEKNRIGSVAENTIYGIHGVLDREKSSALPLTVTEIAYRQEIETGPATVRMCVDNTVEEYEAEITEIDLGSENTNKNFVLEITDQRLLQILEDGILTDAQGRRVDFKNTVIIMTSNVGARLITEQKKMGFASIAETADPIASQKQIKNDVMAELKKAFQPEFLNRVDDIIVFQQLTEENIQEIARRMLRTLDKRLAGMDMSCQVSDRAVAEIAKAGFDPVYGARPLRRAIQSKIEDTLSEQLLTGKFRAGDVIQIDAENGEFQFSQAT